MAVKASMKGQRSAHSAPASGITSRPIEIVAMADKNTRILWAVLAKGKEPVCRWAVCSLCRSSFAAYAFTANRMTRALMR